MCKAICIVVALMVPGVVLAQQPAPQPDSAFLQRAIISLQNQRNQALDAQASAEARDNLLAEENAKLKAKIEELKKKLDADKKEQEHAQ